MHLHFLSRGLPRLHVPRHPSDEEKRKLLRETCGPMMNLWPFTGEQPDNTLRRIVPGAILRRCMPMLVHAQSAAVSELQLPL